MHTPLHFKNARRFRFSQVLQLCKHLLLPSIFNIFFFNDFYFNVIYCITFQKSYSEMKFFILILTSPLLVSACPILSTCVIAICNLSIYFFNFTPYYLLGEQSCWMHHSTRMSAGRKTIAGEKITLFCVAPSWHQHIVALWSQLQFFFFLQRHVPEGKHHWAITGHNLHHSDEQQL